MTSTTALTAAKQQLRRSMKQKLSAIPPDVVLAQSRQIFETVKTVGAYRNARRISIYLSMPSAEVQTDAIVRHALASGKQVYIPYLHSSPLPLPNTPTRVMDMVHLQDLQDYESLKRDAWGIPSVDPTTVNKRQRILGDGQGLQSGSASLDLVLVPGVAFGLDDNGSIRRLGHGKGFYDFFINRYISRQTTEHERARPPLLYGLALTEQVIPAGEGEPIPVGPFDRSLHGLLLGNGDIRESSDGAKLP